MKTDRSSKVERKVIYITLAKTTGNYFGQTLLQWMFKGGGWRPRESSKAKDIAKNDKIRRELNLVLRDMTTGIYTPEVEKLFKKVGLPIQFHLDKISRAYTSYNEPERYIVSGSGDERHLTEWLEQKQIKYEVRNVAIQ